MIFRCEVLESQAVGRYDFLDASTLFKKRAALIGPEVPVQSKLEPADGVLISFSSYDCTAMESQKPAPSFLPADTCFHIESGRSLFISQHAICANGAPIRLSFFTDSRCLRPRKSEENSSANFQTLDTYPGPACHRTDARSVAFICGDNEWRYFEDLPPYKHKEVQSLLLPELPTNSIIEFQPESAQLKFSDRLSLTGSKSKPSLKGHGAEISIQLD
jgi:hypothetical protein